MADTRREITDARREARLYGACTRVMLRWCAVRWDIVQFATRAAHYAIQAMRLEERDAEASDG